MTRRVPSRLDEVAGSSSDELTGYRRSGFHALKAQGKGTSHGARMPGKLAVEIVAPRLIPIHEPRVVDHPATEIVLLEQRRFLDARVRRLQIRDLLQPILPDVRVVER